MHTLHLKKPLAFFDLETTGVNIVRDRIVEISVVKALVNGETEIRTRRINPEMPIPLESSLIHGIYDEDVKDAPTFKSIAKNLASFLEGCDLAGFNSNRFDIPMLVEEFLRVGVDFDIKNRRMVDVQRIYHMMEPRNLGAAYKFYCGKTLDNAHSAEADACATWDVLQSQVERYPQLGLTVDSILKCIGEENHVDFARRMVMENGREIFNFGKHKGRAVTDVLKAEPQYYDWMMKGDFPLHTKHKLTEVFNRMMLKKG